MKGGRPDKSIILLPGLWLGNFWTSEAAFSLATLFCRLAVLFQRHLDWRQKVTIQVFRFRLFVIAGVLSQYGRQTTIKLAVPPPERRHAIA